MDFALDSDELLALVQVVLIDITLAGDNAIVVGLAAAGVEKSRRAQVIFWGIAAAVIMRIGFAAITVQLLQLPGILFVGGLLLAFVCWRLGWEMLAVHRREQALAAGGGPAAPTAVEAAPKSMSSAIFQIVVADVSMSLDNVLAVAGAAMHHPFALYVGLALAVVLMGAAATFIARLLHRFPWIGWIGLAIIVYVSIDMMLHGWGDFWNFVQPFIARA
jgi:YjbE family integral membrane protein